MRGSCALTSPGAVCAMTGRDSTPRAIVGDPVDEPMAGLRGIPQESCRLTRASGSLRRASRHQHHHVIDDGVDRHRRGVDVDRILGQRERRDRARRVGLVARHQVALHVGEARLAAGVRGIGGAAPGALFGRRIEIDLQVGVAETPPCRCRGLPSPRRRRRPARAAGATSTSRTCGRRATAAAALSIVRRADRARHIVAVDRDAAVPAGRRRARASAGDRASSSSGRPSCAAFHATARYIAPVSTWR